MRIYGRNTIIDKITNQRAREFTELYHRDSCPKKITDMISIGLSYNNELIAVAIFGNPRTKQKQRKYSKELIRLTFKKNISVVGGASKLLKYAMKELNFYDFFTYQDTTGKNTNVYELSGMTLVTQEKQKEYLVKNGYMLKTANRKQKYGIAYVTQYGPDRILGTHYGQNTGKTNKQLFIDAGFHVETTTGDKVYDWFNPNWTHFVYKLTANNSQGYYIGVHSIPIKNATKAQCVDFDNYMGSGSRKFQNWKNKYSLQKEIIYIGPSRSDVINKEKELLGDKYLTDPNCKNSTNGSKGSARISVNHEMPKKGQDLETLYPDIAKQWSNKNLTSPNDYKPKSSAKVWWICNKGHEWKAQISDRTNGTQCPVCANKKIINGYNDLSTLYPDVAQRWSKKNKIKPTEVSPYSSKKVWWHCSKGHEYYSSIYSQLKHGCPYETGNKVLTGYNDFATKYPQLVKYWQSSDISPESVTPSSKKVITWKGECGHKWTRAVFLFVKSQKCPYCTNKKVLPGFNDFATKYPELAEEWSDKNDIQPNEVLPGTNKEVWWTSKKCGHSWKLSIKRRIKSKGCPYENGVVLSGYNDLATINPMLAKEWHDKRDIKLFTANSAKKVTWKCSNCKHVWDAIISNRNNGAKCPKCHHAIN